MSGRVVPKALESFGFHKISKDEADLIRNKEEVKYLTAKLKRTEAERAKHEAEMEAKQAAAMTHLPINGNDDDNDYVTSLNQAINGIMDVTTTKTHRPTANKRVYRSERPHNWKEIANHYLVYNSVDKTILDFDLLKLNPKHSTLDSTLRRWKEDLVKKKERKKIKRSSIVGKIIDDELANVVNNYFKHGVPMTNLILRSSLLAILERHGRHDILERLNYFDPRNVPGSKWFIRIGDAWCQRFYKRHNFSSRVATTKMREDLPADYEPTLEVAPEVNAVRHSTRNRAMNSMFGSLKRGKYSKS